MRGGVVSACPSATHSARWNKFLRIPSHRLAVKKQQARTSRPRAGAWNPPGLCTRMRGPAPDASDASARLLSPNQGFGSHVSVLCC